MKKASWGCCVLLFDSSGEPAGHPDVSDSFAPGSSRTEFDVGRTSCEDGLCATVYAPMDYESSMYCSTCCIRGDLGQSHLCSFSGPVEIPNTWIWREGHLNRSWNEKTEEITQCHNFSSPGASGAEYVSFNRLFGSGPQSGITWAGFRRWLVSFKMRNFIVASHGGSSFSLFCFKPLFRGSCYYAHQCDRSPPGGCVSFCVCGGAGANSWSDCDKLVLFLSATQNVLFPSCCLMQHNFLPHTHDSSFCPHFSRKFAVHRIRCCSESTGASGTEAISCSSSVGRYHWQEWWREWCWWATAELTFKEDVQDEASLGNEWRWAILCDWADRCCDKAQSFLLQNLSQGRLCADSWSSRDFAALPGQQTLSARSTFAVGNAKLGSAWLGGERHEASRGRAPARKNREGCFGRERQGVPILRRRQCWQNWCCGPESGGDGESFIAHWRAAFGWKLRARLPSLGAVHFVCRSCQHGCHVVTRRGLG